MPHTGRILNRIAQIHVDGGFIEMNNYILEATARHDVIIQLIIQQADAGNPDYDVYVTATGRLSNKLGRLRDWQPGNFAGAQMVLELVVTKLWSRMQFCNISMVSQISWKIWRPTKPPRRQKDTHVRNKSSKTEGPTCWRCSEIPTPRR